VGLGSRLLRRSCCPAGTSGAWGSELEELRHGSLKRGAAWLVLLPLRSSVRLVLGMLSKQNAED